jgi:predicted GTPase
LKSRLLLAVLARRRCILSYSDLHHSKVMELGSRCLAAGAAFEMLAPATTMLPSRKPVVAVVAVRTGCGKSQASRYVINRLKEHGLTCTLVRHPMPYGERRKTSLRVLWWRQL